MRLHLSVIIPTLNKLTTAQLLAERLRSLLPTLALEVIVVTPGGDAPRDPSGLVRCIGDAGRGVYAAYTEGLRAAGGEYIWFMGDDDYPLDAAAEIGGFLQSGIVDVLVAPVVFSSGRIYRPTQKLLLLHFLNWCQQGVIYRRRVLLQHRFFRRLTVQADQYVNILLRADPAVRLAFIAGPICMFGVHGVSGRLRDEGYRSLRPALARRTLGAGAFLLFKALVCLEPLVKRVVRIRA
jgi:glycosyltransferase involved in cell wall biosynthesis